MAAWRIAADAFRCAAAASVCSGAWRNVCAQRRRCIVTRRQTALRARPASLSPYLLWRCPPYIMRRITRVPYNNRISAAAKTYQHLSRCTQRSHRVPFKRALSSARALCAARLGALRAMAQRAWLVSARRRRAPYARGDRRRRRKRRSLPHLSHHIFTLTYSAFLPTSSVICAPLYASSQHVCRAARRGGSDA